MPLKVQFDCHIRDEQSWDRDEVRKVNESAFGRPDEAYLIEGLREEGVILLSFVAEVDGNIVGHILFSRMYIDTDRGTVPVVSLAPMAVAPSHQKRGIGSGLIRHGLTELHATGERIVIVLGHKHYYPRFGFSSEKARNIASPFPADAFMALELSDGALADVRGAARYPAAFGL